MIASLLQAFFSVALSGFFKLFGVNRDEQIGALKEANKAQAEELKDAQLDKNISDRVDNMSDDDFERLRDKLNHRPE